jgi:hypothetical protein
VRDLAVGKFLRMSYADVRALPLAVYLVALEEMTAAHTPAPDEAPV